jgi:uncharacterized protein (TIGR01777 family)
MKIAVTGSHGLLARHLIPRLRGRGDVIVPVVRAGAGSDDGAGSGNGAGTISWDPAAGVADPADFDDVDAVIHLAGVGIAARRWNDAHKQAVLDSRVKGTVLLARTLAALEGGPRTLLSASAIGYYGDRDDELLTEASPSGSGFLAEVCRRWEDATVPAAQAGIRVVALRTGLVQATDGGALATSLPVFKLALGARFGRGRQWWSWIAIDDEVGAIVHALDNETISGPLNLVAPAPVTNAEYTATLARVLRRPAVLSVPQLALKALLGPEMASELLLASQRVAPSVLERTGYQWRHRTLEPALRALLGS